MEEKDQNHHSAMSPKVASPLAVDSIVCLPCVCFVWLQPRNGCKICSQPYDSLVSHCVWLTLFITVCVRLLQTVVDTCTRVPLMATCVPQR